MGKTSAEHMKTLSLQAKGSWPRIHEEGKWKYIIASKQTESFNEWRRTNCCKRIYLTKNQNMEATERNKTPPVTKKGFATPPAYGKTIKKLKRQLLKSPSKWVEAVIGLVNEVGLKMKESDLNRNRKEHGGLSDEVKSQVVDFYYWTDVIYTATGLKDEITAWTEKGRKWEKMRWEKTRKYYLTMYLCEVYVCLKLFTQAVK